MKEDKLYWTQKDGSKINIDDMTIDHLRNVLKMIVRNNYNINSKCPHNIEDAISFNDEEVYKLINKTQYQTENEDNLWK